MGNWSELQRDLLGLIAKKHTVAADRVRFSGVCRNWLSVAQSETNYLPCNPPWLMLVENSDHDSNLRGFAGLTDGKEGKETFDLDLPIAKGTRCAGSTGCWLVMVELLGDMHLLNPFTRTKIDLPPLSSFDEFRDYCENEEIDMEDENSNFEIRDKFISEKVVLSFPKFKSPEEDFIAVAIVDGKKRKSLAYTTKGAKSWKSVEEGDAKSWKDRENVYYGFYDVTFYQGKFYAVNGLGSVFEFNISSKLNDHKPKLVPISDRISDPKNGIYGNRRYLFEFRGMLLHVLKDLHLFDRVRDGESDFFFHDYRTALFNIYKLDFLTGEWVEVNDLGQHSVFVGYNTCVSLLASSSSTFKPNCIYFTDDYHDGYLNGGPFPGGRDMGVVNLVDRTIGPHYTGTAHYYVYKLDFLTGEWVKVNDLGQHSIFVGYNTCVSLLASSTSTFKPNYIFFTDDYHVGYLNGSPFAGGRDMD